MNEGITIEPTEGTYDEDALKYPDVYDAIQYKDTIIYNRDGTTIFSYWTNGTPGITFEHETIEAAQQKMETWYEELKGNDGISRIIR